MRIPRVTITHLVILVAVVAVNLAVWLAVFAYDDGLLLGLGLMCLALQLGCFRLISTRGTTRSFWVGFIIFGTAASFLCGFIHLSQRFSLETLSTVRFYWNVSFYQTAMFAGLSTWWFYTHPFIDRTMIALYYSLPPLLIALVGGLLFRQIALNGNTIETPPNMRKVG